MPEPLNQNDLATAECQSGAGPSLRAHGKWIRPVIVIVLVGVLAMLATVPLDWKNQAVLGLLLFFAALILNRRRSADLAATNAMMVISIFTATRYLWWRYSETGSYLVANWSTIPVADLFFVFALLGAEGYAFVILVLGYFQSVRPLKRKPAPLPALTDEWPSVDVLIPTYNEPLEVVRTTILAARTMDWPADRLNVYVLDDGRRAEIHDLAELCGVNYLARLDNEGAKAGNINHALNLTNGEFVAVFDCDHIPTRSFLQVTMGSFLKDSGLAMVQTPHHFYSPDPFERNLNTFRRVPNESELFYGILQDGNDFWNASFFCGSCAVLRRRAIEQIGGIATETVTEDSHSALRLQRLGWNTAYINIPQAAGLATANIADHITQRIRWARGMVQVLRIERPLFAGGLNLAQRLCYFNAVLHFLHASPRLIFLTAPLVYLLLGRSNLYGYVWAILAYVVPHLLIATLTNSRVQGGHRHSFWNEVFETVLAPYILIPTLLALVNPRWGKFNVTPKRTVVTQSYFDLRIAAPFILLLLLNLAGAGAAALQLWNGVDSQGTVAVNLVWTAINVLILGATLSVPWERHQLRTSARVPMRRDVTLLLPDGSAVEGVALDMSVSGASMQLARSSPLKPGDAVSVLFSIDGGPHAVHAEIRRTHGLRLGLSFSRSSIEDQEAITRLIFGRADAWLDWTDGRPQDRPLRSLGRIVLFALRGIFMVPKGLFSSPASDEPVTARPERKSAPSFPILGLVILLSLAFALKSDAAEPFADIHDLPTLGQRQAITFRGRDGRTTLRFGVPATKVVREAGLALHFRSSEGFLPDSRITISLNGSAVGAVSMAAQAVRGDAPQQVQLTLPSDLVVSDNIITLQFSGICTGGCRESSHWVRIEPSSSVRLSGTMLELANDLRLLPAPFFDPSVHRALRIPVVFTEAPDRTTLEAAGVVASWFGVMGDDRGAQFPVTFKIPESGDAVVITRITHELAERLKMQPGHGPAIALRANPNDSYGKLLVVAGTTAEEIRIAAAALSIGQYALSGDTAAITKISLPSVSRPNEAPRWLNIEKDGGLCYGVAPDQLRLQGSGTVSLYFRLPPDLSFGQRSTVPLHLAFKTNSASGEQKADVRVRLNNVPLTTIRTNVSEIPSVMRQTVSLPVSSLYPNNTLEVEFVFSGGKPAGDDRYPEAAVLPNTSIDLRGIPRFVELPRLDLTLKAGFPFTRLADLSGTAVVLPEKPKPDEIALYLALMGRFGAQTGSPVLRVSAITPAAISQMAAKDLLVIGTPDNQPLISRWADLMPVRADGGRVRPGELTNGFSFLAQAPIFALGKELRRLNDALVVDPRPEAIIQGFTSPINRDKSVVLISSPDNFQAALATLASGNLDDVSGAASLLSNGRFQSFALIKSGNHIGQLSWREVFNNWIAANFWLIALFTVAVAILMARWFQTWADRHAVLRLQGES